MPDTSFQNEKKMNGNVICKLKLRSQEMRSEYKKKVAAFATHKNMRRHENGKKK